MTPDSEFATLVLSDRLDAKEAGSLLGDLMGARGHDLDVDASSVRRLTAQCLQVLLSAQGTWAADGRAFRISTLSSEFRDAVALMGGAALLDPAAVQD